MCHRLAAIVEQSYAGDDAAFRQRCRSAQRRRRAAIALLRICTGIVPDDARLQSALARSLALALPLRLKRPVLVEAALPVSDCSVLAREAREEGATRGWSSLHRKYSTQDMPIERLPSGARLRARLASCLLPEFPRRFGSSRFGPAEALRFANLFVVRYTTDGRHGQRGLAGHVDEPLVSFVLTLSASDEYAGGGTAFDIGGWRGRQVVRPDQGDAVCFLGRLWHEALEISGGERLVLVGLIERREMTEERNCHAP